ncbi:hypothetical protein [Rhizobium rhizogenes]|uniref:hypothetical protein n=1 Tax=Rhizobium rhizogenes TaxID=359 RepID=UPI0015720402|nr:hypothetical protein [Rhizobium rhizogenes]NTF42009.1 hypothetical protein [Rhizobium rhizogenes]
MQNAEPLLTSISDPDSGCTVLFEDNGHVAYAYLLAADGEIIGDVWLYNVGEPPAEPPWHDKEEMPFANPREFVREDLAFEFAKQPSDIVVLWKTSEQYGPMARIYLHSRLFGILSPGAKPGWSLLAAKNGPLARKLTSNFEELPAQT